MFLSQKMKRQSIFQSKSTQIFSNSMNKLHISELMSGHPTLKKVTRQIFVLSKHFQSDKNHDSFLFSFLLLFVGLMFQPIFLNVLCKRLMIIVKIKNWGVLYDQVYHHTLRFDSMKKSNVLAFLIFFGYFTALW